MWSTTVPPIWFSRWKTRVLTCNIRMEFRTTKVSNAAFDSLYTTLSYYTLLYVFITRRVWPNGFLFNYSLDALSNYCTYQFSPIIPSFSPWHSYFLTTTVFPYSMASAHFLYLLYITLSLLSGINYLSNWRHGQLVVMAKEVHNTRVYSSWNSF